MTADTLGRALMSNAAARADVTLLDAVLDRLADNGRVRTMTTMLASPATRRHVRLYFADARLQRPVGEQGLAGGLAVPGDDYLGVFARNDTPLALLHRREIHQVVRLRADGTADVTRTVQIRATAPSLAVPPRFARQFARSGAVPSARTTLVGYVPDQARKVRLSGDGGVRTDPLVVREPGLRAVAGSMQLRPGAAAYRLTYSLPRRGAIGRYTLTMDPQPLVAPAAVRLDVFAPAGRSFARGKGWVVDGGQARWTGVLDRPRTLTLKPAG